MVRTQLQKDPPPLVPTMTESNWTLHGGVQTEVGRDPYALGDRRLEVRRHKQFERGGERGGEAEGREGMTQE